MEVIRNGNFLQCTWNLPTKYEIESFDRICRIGEVLFNELTFFPKVRSIQRSGTLAIVICDALEGMPFNRYIWDLNSGLENLQKLYDNLYQWPAIFQKVAKKLDSPNLDSGLVFERPMSNHIYISSEGKIFTLDFTCIRSVEDGKFIRSSENISWLETVKRQITCAYYFHVGKSLSSIDNSDEEYNKKLKDKQQEILKLELRLKTHKEKLNNSINKDAIKHKIGEAAYQLHFGDDSE